MSSHTTNIYIVILNYNGWQDTVECLESVLRSSYRRFSIVVVDNCSTDESLDRIRSCLRGRDDVRQEFPSGDKENDHSIGVEVIKAPYNGGYAYGNNLGIQFALSRADCSHAWLLNNDTLVDPESLGGLMAEFDRLARSQKLGLLGCVQRYHSDPGVIQAVAGGFNKWKSRFWNIGAGDAYSEGGLVVPDFAYVYGASMLISRQCLEEVGQLNEDYFMYFEEIDFAERAKKAAYALGVAPAVSILHKYRSTVSKQSTGFQEYYMRRNTIGFYRVHYPLLVIIPLLKILALAMKYTFSDLELTRIYLRAVGDSLLGKTGNSFQDG